MITVEKYIVCETPKFTYLEPLHWAGGKREPRESQSKCAVPSFQSVPSSLRCSPASPTKPGSRSDALMHVPSLPSALVTGPSRPDKPEVLRSSATARESHSGESSGIGVRASERARLSHPWDWNNEPGARWPIAEGDGGRRERGGCPSPRRRSAVRGCGGKWPAVLEKRMSIRVFQIRDDMWTSGSVRLVHRGSRGAPGATGMGAAL